MGCHGFKHSGMCEQRAYSCIMFCYVITLSVLFHCACFKLFVYLTRACQNRFVCFKAADYAVVKFKWDSFNSTLFQWDFLAEEKIASLAIFIMFCFSFDMHKLYPCSLLVP